MKLVLKKPRPVEVLIYDRVGLEFIRQVLSKETNWGVLDVRSKEINLHPKVFIRFICIIFRRAISTDQFWRMSNTRMALELASIQVVGPRVVVSFIDNSQRFNILSRLYPNARFIAMQNAFRTSEVSDMARYLCVTNLICFGEETVERYKRSGCKVGRYIVAGSLRADLYRQNVKQQQEKKYDLCWISQYKPSRFERNLPGLEFGSLRLVEFIQQYCKEKGMTLAIAGNCKESTQPREYRYLRNIITETEYSFVPNDYHNFSSYKVIDQSQLTLVINSTLGYEALSGGSKLLFCNFTGDNYFDVPEPYADGIWSLRGSDISYAAFSSRLDLLLDMTDSDWYSATHEIFQYFIRSNNENSAANVVRCEVERSLLPIAQTVGNSAADID